MPSRLRPTDRISLLPAGEDDSIVAIDGAAAESSEIAGRPRIEHAFEYDGGLGLVTRDIEFYGYQVMAMFFDRQGRYVDRFLISDWLSPLILVSYGRGVIVVDSGLVRTRLTVGEDAPGWRHLLGDLVARWHLFFAGFAGPWMVGAWMSLGPGHPALARSWRAPVAAWQPAIDATEAEWRNDTPAEDDRRAIEALPPMLAAIVARVGAKQRAIRWWEARNPCERFRRFRPRNPQADPAGS